MNILLTDEEMRELHKLPDEYGKVYATAKAQSRRATEQVESRFKREVIPSGSQAYTQEEMGLLQRLNSAYYMITKEDWEALLKDVED